MLLKCFPQLKNERNKKKMHPQNLKVVDNIFQNLRHNSQFTKHLGREKVSLSISLSRILKWVQAAVHSGRVKLVPGPIADRNYCRLCSADAPHLEPLPLRYFYHRRLRHHSRSIHAKFCNFLFYFNFIFCCFVIYRCSMIGLS